MGGGYENAVGRIAAGRSNFRTFDSCRSFALRELGQLPREPELWFPSIHATHSIWGRPSAEHALWLQKRLKIIIGNTMRATALTISYSCRLILPSSPAGCDLGSGDSSPASC